VSDDAKPSGSRRAPLFPAWTDHLLKLLGTGAAFSGVYVVVLATFGISPWAIDVGYMPEQPLPYSHTIHAGQLGLDCRYCHNTVEHAGFAAIPPTQTCMNCHDKIRPNDARNLGPVLASYQSGEPIEWIKVHNLPDYVYFNHSAHVTRGVSCVSCHGRVDRMDEVYQAMPLSMAWCLDCHRDPAPNIRPVDRGEVELLAANRLIELPPAVEGGIDPVSRFLEQAAVTQLGWGDDIAPESREAIGRALLIDRGLLDGEGNPTVRLEVLTSCSTCHR